MKDLRTQITNSFDQDELRGLCFDLNVAFDNLDGKTRDTKIIALLEYCKRRGIVESLIKRCQELRPHLVWELIPTDISIQLQENNGLRTELDRLRNEAEKAAIHLDLPTLNEILGMVSVLAEGGTNETEAGQLLREVADLRTRLREKLGAASTLLVMGDFRRAYEIIREFVECGALVLIDGSGTFGKVNGEVSIALVFSVVRQRYLSSIIDLCQQKIKYAEGIRESHPRLAIKSLEQAHELSTDELLTSEDRNELSDLVRSLEHRMWEIKSILGETT